MKYSIHIRPFFDLVTKPPLILHVVLKKFTKVKYPYIIRDRPLTKY
jgi:hypothetical protein